MIACGFPLTADFRRLYRAADTHLYSQCQSEYQVERFQALPLHSTPQAISCCSHFHGNPAFLFAIWPVSIRFALWNSGCMRTSRTIVVHGLLEVDGIQYPNLIPKVKQHFSALGNNTAFGIGNNKAGGIFLGGALHQI